MFSQSNLQRSIISLFAVVAMGLQLLNPVSENRSHQIDRINVKTSSLPTEVQDSLASEDEKLEILEIVTPRRKGGLLSAEGLSSYLFEKVTQPSAFDPDEFVVEKRDENIFIVYSIANQGADSAILDINIVERAKGIVSDAQQYKISVDKPSGEASAEVSSEGETLWSGTLDEIEMETTAVMTHRRPDYGTAYDACIRSVDSLCAVGGGVSGAIVCALLGFTVIGGIVCAGVVALIGMFGCNSAKEKVCANARRR